jgi:SAM-dependent methyltransferase
MSDGARVDMVDYSAEYLQQYADRSFETVLVEQRRAEVLRALARHPHRRVLEVGCGLEPLFVHATGWDAFTVVEPSEEFVRNARAVAGERADVRVLQGFFEDVQPALATGSFDLVVVSSLLHEVPDPRALLRAVRGVCGPETVVHLNVPNMRSFHRLLALEMGLIASVFEPSEIERRFQRHTRYDRDTLLALVTDERFRVVGSGSYFVKPFTHGQMEAMLGAGIIDARVIDGLARMVRYMPDLGCEMYVDLVPA